VPTTPTFNLCMSWTGDTVPVSLLAPTYCLGKCSTASQASQAGRPMGHNGRRAQQGTTSASRHSGSSRAAALTSLHREPALTWYMYSPPLHTHTDLTLEKKRCCAMFSPHLGHIRGTALPAVCPGFYCIVHQHLNSIQQNLAFLYAHMHQMWQLCSSFHSHLFPCVRMSCLPSNQEKANYNRACSPVGYQVWNP
jgi:hypothetical protein